MELVTVDRSATPLKNERMVFTKDDRKKLGRRLRAMRTERELDQTDVVADPKAGGLSLGTLQAIEGAWYEVRDQNLEKYARFFGTTAVKILKGESKPVTSDDPLLKDLNEEHLEIARSYMRARKRVRTCVELLFNHPDEHQLTTILLSLDKLSVDVLNKVVALLEQPNEWSIEFATRLQRLAPDVHLEFENLLAHVEKRLAGIAIDEHSKKSGPKKKL